MSGTASTSRWRTLRSDRSTARARRRPRTWTRVEASMQTRANSVRRPSLPSPSRSRSLSRRLRHAATRSAQLLEEEDRDTLPGTGLGVTRIREGLLGVHLILRAESACRVHAAVGTGRRVHRAPTWCNRRLPVRTSSTPAKRFCTASTCSAACSARSASLMAVAVWAILHMATVSWLRRRAACARAREPSGARRTLHLCSALPVGTRLISSFMSSSYLPTRPGTAPRDAHRDTDRGTR